MPVSAQNTAAAIASSSQVAWLALLTITAPGFAPLYVVNNTEPVWSRGIQFVPYPFQVTMPQDDSESLPSVSLVISNLDRAIMEFVRSQRDPPHIAIEIVTSQWPDLVEKSLTFLRMVNISYDAMQVTGQLDVDDFLTGAFPGESYVPPQFPGLFQ